MRSADVAVVIPVYQRPAIVLEALESVAAQTLAPARIVVVDDGSGDGTAEAAQAWLEAASGDFERSVIRQEHAGAGAGRNRGVAACSDHAFVAFLDSDDQWPADFLERTVACLADDPAAVAVSVDQRMHQPAHRDAAPPAAPEPRSLAGIPEDPTDWLIRNDGGVLSATLFRTEPAHRIGFDTGLASGQDWKMALELSLLGSWLYAPGAPVEMGRTHRRRPGEAGHLSLRFDDRHRRWATILEQFVLAHPADPRLRAEEYAPSLALRWRRAARELAGQGRFGDAAACARSSARWWRAHRAWGRAAVASLGGFALAVAARLRPGASEVAPGSRSKG